MQLAALRGLAKSPRSGRKTARRCEAIVGAGGEIWCEIVRPDQDAAALLAPDARPDHGRAGDGARRRAARAAGAARLPAGLAFPGRRRREGGDRGHRAGARAAGGGRHRPAGAAATVRRLRQFPQLSGRPHRALRRPQVAPGPGAAAQRRDPRAGLLCRRRASPRARPTPRAGASPRFWTECRGARRGEPGVATSSSVRLVRRTARDIRDLHARAFGPGRFARTAYRVREGTPEFSPFCRVCRIDGRLAAAVRFTPDSDRRQGRRTPARPAGRRARFRQPGLRARAGRQGA